MRRHLCCKLVSVWVLALCLCGHGIAAAQSPLVAAPHAVKPANPGSGAIAAALTARLDLDFTETPLVDVIDFLQSKTGVTFYIRRKSLDEAGVNVDAPINSHFGAIRVETWLDLFLDELDLTWYEKDDLIVITTPEDAESNLVTRVYDCRDLLALPLGWQPAGAKSGGNESTQREVERAEAAAKAKAAAIGCGSIDPRPLRPADPAERLMEVISRAVDIHTWDDVGGPGTMGEYSGLLVVTQTDRIHRKISRVLDMLREAAGLDVPKTGKVVR